MQFALWAATCLVAAAALHRRPLLLALVAATVWCAVPGISGHWITGVSSGPLDVHPAAVLVLAIVVVQVVAHPRDLMLAVRYRPEWWVLLGTVCLVALTAGLFAGHGLVTVSAAVDQVIAPLSLFLILGGVLLRRPSGLEVIRRWALGVAAFEAVMALAQYAVKAPLAYGSDFAAAPSFKISMDRWMGTFDHSLVLSLFLVIAVFLLAGLRHWWSILPLMLLFLSGLLVTQSRVGVALGLVGLLYVTLRARLSTAQRALTVVPVALGALFALASGAGAALASRVADDTGSASARSEALTYFLSHAQGYLWLGGGLDSSYDVANLAGLGTSFESAILMYAIDLGGVVALMYFGVMALITLRSFGGSVPRGVSGPAVVALLVPQSFSALSGTTAVPMMVWLVFAMAAFSAVPAVRVGRPSVLSGSASGHPRPTRMPQPSGSR